MKRRGKSDGEKRDEEKEEGEKREEEEGGLPISWGTLRIISVLETQTPGGAPRHS